MTGAKDRTARWNRYWDKKSRSYDKEMRFFDKHLFGDSRFWACGQAGGNVLEVAVGTGLNLAAYPNNITLTVGLTPFGRHKVRRLVPSD